MSRVLVHHVLVKDLGVMEKVAREIETVMRNVPGISSTYAERVVDGYYLDIVPDRDALARYGVDRRQSPGHHFDGVRWSTP